MFYYILLFLLLALLGIGYYFARVALYPKVFPYEETYQHEVEAGKIDPGEFEGWHKEEISIRSPYGYNLHGFYFPLPDSQKTVVIVHGITLSLFASVKYMPIFRSRGFNVLIYDQRTHGRSGGANCTFGFYEKHDLKAVVDWALTRLGPNGKLGTHGESLGGATVLQHAAIDPRLSFVIADCPYSDLRPLFAYRTRVEYHLPAFPLLEFASLMCYLLSGMRFSDVRPITAVRTVSTPVLFCHGAQDDYIPPQMSMDLAHAKQNGLSRLYLAPNARHAEAYWNNRAEYDQKVGEFLNEAGLI
jgi:uncharacterized protein